VDVDELARGSFVCELHLLRGKRLLRCLGSTVLLGDVHRAADNRVMLRRRGGRVLGLDGARRLRRWGLRSTALGLLGLARLLRRRAALLFVMRDDAGIYGLRSRRKDAEPRFERNPTTLVGRESTLLHEA